MDRLSAPLTSHAAPTPPGGRIDFLDALRGLAVMAIFVVNIKAMAMPFPWYVNWQAWTTDAERAVAIAHIFIIDDKWRTIFTALYGAGLALIGARVDAREGDSGDLLRTRSYWLMAFGLWHMICVWYGDILFTYAVAGLIAIPFRRLALRWLWIWGAAITLIGVIWMAVFQLLPTLSPDMSAAFKPWMWSTDLEVHADDIATFGGSPMAQIMERLGQSFFIAFGAVIMGTTVLSAGVMILGMALFRSGLLRGEWTARRCFWLGGAALGSAWALDAVQVIFVSTQGQTFAAFSQLSTLQQIDGVLGGFGYICLMAGLWRIGARVGALASVGRMAFTNYITCSLIGTSLAGGQGLGWYGEANLLTLMGVVAVSCGGMMIWSLRWLRIFRFGPFEWLWRTLVYGRTQPIWR